MLYKKLSKSDTNSNGRILLPTKSVKNDILPYVGDDDLRERIRGSNKLVEVELVNDIDGKMFTLWLAYESKSYVFTHFYEVVRFYNLNAGDTVEFEPREFGDKIIIGFKFYRYPALPPLTV
ncbi:hypothetical protein R6Q59_034298 [Mikania micrantha]